MKVKISNSHQEKILPWIVKVALSLIFSKMVPIYDVNNNNPSIFQTSSSSLAASMAQNKLQILEFPFKAIKVSEKRMKNSWNYCLTQWYQFFSIDQFFKNWFQDQFLDDRFERFSQSTLGKIEKLNFKIQKNSCSWNAKMSSKMK